MSTTSLYVELVVIGVQTTMWWALLLDCVEHGIIKTLLNLTNSALLIVLFLGMAYVIGMIFDRLANAVFQRKENDVRKASGLQAKSSLLVTETDKMKDHQSYTRSKYRILRSTTINIPLISICAVVNILINHTNKIQLVIAILIIGVVFTVVSYWGTLCTIKDFYDKARVIELYGNKNTN
jgi:hypothetical protein